MFAKSTVFIIGAGASAEFNMPVGAVLMSQVAASLRFGTAAGNPANSVLLSQIRGRLNAEKVSRLVDCGHRLASLVPHFVSMDEVLHFLSDDPEIVELGKLAIANEILKAERESHLRKAIGGDENSIVACESTWANSFLKMALGATRSCDIGSLFANVTIIDFNYDRILPHYLFWSLRQNFGLSQEAAAESIHSLQIIHPYGSLGRLEWEQGHRLVPFAHDGGHLPSIASGIRTYTQENQGPQKAKIKNAIELASVIIVLGFGFHNQNVGLLTIDRELRPMHIFMTVLGINENNHAAISNRVRAAFGTKSLPVALAATCRSLLEQLRPSIMMAAS